MIDFVIDATAASVCHSCTTSDASGAMLMLVVHILKIHHCEEGKEML